MPSKTICKVLAVVVVSIGCAFSHGAMAQGTIESLLQANVCLGCHQVDVPRVGPPFTAVAQRYAGQPGAEEILASSIRNGGKHRWGKLSMAAQPQVTPEEAHEIARWILSLPNKNP